MQSQASLQQSSLQKLLERQEQELEEEESHEAAVATFQPGAFTFLKYGAQFKPKVEPVPVQS